MRDDEVERQVSPRMERQAILNSDEPPVLRVVIDEGAVRRMVGGPAVMKAQINKLIKESQRSNIQILMLPYAAGVGFDGSFVILEFPPLPAPYPDAADDRMVYVADNLPGVVAVRDSKNPARPALIFTPDEWKAFVGGVRDGEFDL